MLWFTQKELTPSVPRASIPSSPRECTFGRYTPLSMTHVAYSRGTLRSFAPPPEKKRVTSPPDRPMTLLELSQRTGSLLTKMRENFSLITPFSCCTGTMQCGDNKVEYNSWGNFLTLNTEFESQRLYIQFDFQDRSANFNQRNFKVWVYDLCSDCSEGLRFVPQAPPTIGYELHRFNSFSESLESMLLQRDQVDNFEEFYLFFSYLIDAQRYIVPYPPRFLFR